MPLSAISEGLRAARCPSCKTLIDLDAASRGVPSRQLAVAAPEKWQIDTRPGSFSARWRWFNWSAVFLVPFTLFWNGILMGMATGVTEGFQHPERLLIGLAVPHVWVGLGLAYYCLCLFLNSTRVELKEGTLTVQHSPLWWRGNRKLSASELQQLFVVEKRGNRGSVSYELCALSRDGKRQTLLTGLSDESSARFLEVRLEQALNITDQAVAGELRR